MADKKPNIELLQQFLEKEPPEEVIHWVKEKIGNIGTITDTFLSDQKAHQYLPMLDEARKKQPTIFNTLADQTLQQSKLLKVARPAESPKIK